MPDTQPSPQNSFDANGVRLHYADWGNPHDDAPVMVLLHGLQDCARSWDIFAAAVSAPTTASSHSTTEVMATAPMPRPTPTASVITSPTLNFSSRILD